MKQPFRVAFVGRWENPAQHVVAQLSPSIEPRIFADWSTFEASVGHFGPELVLVREGEGPPPFTAQGLVIRCVNAGEVSHDAHGLETRILAGWPRAEKSHPLNRLLGRSPAIARVRGILSTTAKTSLPLLLMGENGTGKDLAASIAHELSPRAAQPFVAVNCGAVPAALAETEFFGCVRGAFTGAENRTGFCQQAMGGTLFLDEVGEMTPELQSKLLRVLENHELRRVGSARVETTDFRLICATNRDLGALVRDGQFREDLYYRINVLNLRMPALRERKEDLTDLANHFLEAESDSLGRTVTTSPRAAGKMMDYHWPGNLRQLRNVVLRGAVLHDGPEILPEHLDWS